MSSSRMPYQCMVQCGNMLVAARGSTIDLFQDGSLHSTWKCPPIQGAGNAQPLPEVTTKLAAQNLESPSVETNIDSASPPTKKRKLSASGPADEQTASKDGKKKKNRSDVVLSGLEAPAVVALAVTKASNHVVAVTGEDKTIWVFEIIQKDGIHQLKQLSQRTMPKRPCAITVTNDDSTIISADKFGDVFSLPLTPLEATETANLAPHTPEPSTKSFTPAANELTIHSQRNLKALENQRRQTNKPTEKDGATFEHKLLLGHVSMLTHIVLTTLNGRDYIITADRDEHIRVSRGIPQTHVIEGFCLGHSDFVSRICVPSDRPQLLISGGGDDQLFLWEWESGNMISKADLKQFVSAVMQEFDTGEERESPSEPKIAVSGIYYTKQALSDALQDFILVTCEGVPALFTFLLTTENRLHYMQTVKLSGNALAVVINTSADSDQSDTSTQLVVSVDTFHKPGSTTEEWKDANKDTYPLQSYKFQDGKLIQEGAFQVPTPVRDEGDASGSGGSGRLTNLLYSLENLRKREGEAQEEQSR